MRDATKDIIINTGKVRGRVDGADLSTEAMGERAANVAALEQAEAEAETTKEAVRVKIRAGDLEDQSVRDAIADLI